MVQMHKLRLWFAIFTCLALPAQAAALRICVQNIDYYPHYDFSQLPGRGFAADLLPCLAQKQVSTSN